MDYDMNLLKKVPSDFDVNKIGFILLHESESEEEDSMDIDFELTPNIKKESIVDNQNNSKCHICMKVYVNRSNLKRHLSTVHSVKDFQCKICQKTFDKQPQLSGHLRIHGKSKNRVSYTCDHCGKTEKTRVAITQHIEIHQGILGMDINDIFMIWIVIKVKYFWIKTAIFTRNSGHLSSNFYWTLQKLQFWHLNMASYTILKLSGEDLKLYF